MTLLYQGLSDQFEDQHLANPGDIKTRDEHQLIPRLLLTAEFLF